MVKRKLTLGDKVRDLVTGFEGIIIAKTEWLYGCTRVGLQGPLNKEGLVSEAQWFDELQLLESPKDEKKGGPPCCGIETG